MLDSFDYGTELAEVESVRKVWPREGNKTGLVDADLIPYRICHGVKPIMQAQMEHLVESGKCKTLSDTPQFQDLADKACSIYNSWLTAAGCDSAIPYLTHSESNFRIGLAFSRKYKGERKPKPFLFTEIKDFIMQQMDCILSDGDEADDLIAIEATRRNQPFIDAGITLGSQQHKDLCDFVIISSDKDSRITPGAHYDPYHKRHTFGDYLGWLEPVWDKDGKLKELKGCGQKFFYSQLIVGDAADNYQGIPFKGATLAYEVLSSCQTEEELFKAVLAQYKKKFGFLLTMADNYRGGSRMLTAIERMHEQGRLAHMSRYPGDIWRADKAPILWGDKEELWTQ